MSNKRTDIRNAALLSGVHLDCEERGVCVDADSESSVETLAGNAGHLPPISLRYKPSSPRPPRPMTASAASRTGSRTTIRRTQPT